MHFLDIDLADRIAWSHKKGLLSHADALRKLINECGLPEPIALTALQQGPQYYDDEHPPGSAGPAEQIIVEELSDDTIMISVRKPR